MGGVLSITMPFEGQRELRAALALLTAIDILQMRWARPPLPWLYKSGVRYRRESEKTCWLPQEGGCEDWLSAVQVLRQRVGDCEDLACYRAAELRFRAHEAAAAEPIKTPLGWHIIVRRASGRIEDPSRILGMGRQ